MSLILLLAAASVVALAARVIKIPYTVALVLAGLALGATHLVQGVHLTKELLYAVLLPGLLFEAAYQLKLPDLRASARAIFALAVPGVLVAMAATAALLMAAAGRSSSIAGFGWPQALVFAALIAATDPIAVVSLFKSLGAPHRLTVLIEGESLVNDGTAVVLYTVVFAAVSGGSGAGAFSAAVAFVQIVGVGLVVGTVVGFLASAAIRRVRRSEHLDAPMVAITVTIVAAYGSFAITEELHFSGIIATVAAGVVCGSGLGPERTSSASQVAVASFWEFLAFAMNSLVFLLIGLEVSLGRLLARGSSILIAFLAVTLGRAAVVFLVTLALHRTKERIPPRWALMLTWGGLRGALSMVLALALPPEFALRDEIVTMTFGVVLVSIVAQGLTASPLLRALGLAKALPE